MVEFSGYVGRPKNKKWQKENVLIAGKKVQRVIAEQRTRDYSKIIKVVNKMAGRCKYKYQVIRSKGVYIGKGPIKNRKQAYADVKEEESKHFL